MNYVVRKELDFVLQKIKFVILKREDVLILKLEKRKKKKKQKVKQENLKQENLKQKI